MDTAQPAQPTGAGSKELMLPLTRREAILALHAAAGKKRGKELPDSAWSRIVISDGALD